MHEELSESSVLFPDLSIFASYNVQLVLNHLHDKAPIRIVSVRRFRVGGEFLVDFAKNAYAYAPLRSGNANVFSGWNNLACVPLISVRQYNFHN